MAECPASVDGRSVVSRRDPDLLEPRSHGEAVMSDRPPGNGSRWSPFGSHAPLSPARRGAAGASCPRRWTVCSRPDPGRARPRRRLWDGTLSRSRGCQSVPTPCRARPGAASSSCESAVVASRSPPRTSDAWSRAAVPLAPSVSGQHRGLAWCSLDRSSASFP